MWVIFVLQDPQHWIIKFQTIVFPKGGNGGKANIESGRMKRAYDPVTHSQTSKEEEGLLHNSGPETIFFNWKEKPTSKFNRQRNRFIFNICISFSLNLSNSRLRCSTNGMAPWIVSSVVEPKIFLSAPAVTPAPGSRISEFHLRHQLRLQPRFRINLMRYLDNYLFLS